MGLAAIFRGKAPSRRHLGRRQPDAPVSAELLRARDEHVSRLLANHHGLVTTPRPTRDCSIDVDD